MPRWPKPDPHWGPQDVDHMIALAKAVGYFLSQGKTVEQMAKLMSDFQIVRGLYPTTGAWQ